MRSRASPRGYLLVHPSEDCTIRITGPLRIGLTVDTSITGAMSRQAIQKFTLKNQSVRKNGHRMTTAGLHHLLSSAFTSVHHPAPRGIGDQTVDQDALKLSELLARLGTGRSGLDTDAPQGDLSEQCAHRQSRVGAARPEPEPCEGLQKSQLEPLGPPSLLVEDHSV